MLEVELEVTETRRTERVLLRSGARMRFGSEEIQWSPLCEDSEVLMSMEQVVERRTVPVRQPLKGRLVRQ